MHIALTTPGAASFSNAGPPESNRLHAPYTYSDTEVPCAKHDTPYAWATVASRWFAQSTRKAAQLRTDT